MGVVAPVVGGPAIVVGGPVIVVPVLAVVVATVVTGGAALASSETLTTGIPRSGSGMLETGVPAGASTVSVTCLPPISVTSRRRGSAVAGPDRSASSSSAIVQIGAAMRNGLLLIRLLSSSRTAALRGPVERPPRRRSPWKLPSDLDVCKEEPACLQMAGPARCTGPQTIGATNAALEYHTQSARTVNASFKAAVKLP